MNGLKGKIGLMAASLPIMAYLACSSVIADIAKAYPEAPLSLVQMLTYIANLANIFSALFVGKLTPYISKKKLMLITGLLFPICGTIIFFFHPNVMFIAVFTAIMGIGTGVRVTCVPALIHDCYDESTSAHLLGMQGSFISIGSMLFIWVGAQLGKNHWQGCYLSLLLILVVLLIELICVPEGQLDKKLEKGQKRDPIPTSVIFYSVITIFSGIFLAVYNSNISMLISQRGLGSTVQAGYATTIYSLAGMAAGILTGYIITRTKRFTYIIGMFCGLAGMLVSFFGNNLGLLILGGILCGASFSIMAPAGNYYASKEGSDYNRSFCVALFNSCNGFGLFISSTIFSVILRGQSAEVMVPNTFRTSAIGYVFLIPVSFLIFTWLNRRDKKACL